MEKYLIINADDFGMCRAQNAAVMDLFRCGGITSATVMANCRFASEAVSFARENPQFAVGVHLTTTSEWKSWRWGPLAVDVPSLVDESGCFHRDCEAFVRAAKTDEVAAELDAQIAYLRALGLSPSHLDNHMGSLYDACNGEFFLLQVALSLAAKYRLPFRLPTKLTSAMMTNAMLNIRIPQEFAEQGLAEFAAWTAKNGVATPDYLMPGDWNGPQDDSFENYREYIFELYRRFDFGVTETYIHPAHETDEIKAITPCWHRRVWEYRLFCDPMMRQHIAALGIRLINYRDLHQMRFGGDSDAG